MRSGIRTLLAVGGLLATVASSYAAPLVEDSFSDGGVSNGADPYDIGWTISSGSSLAIAAFNVSGNTSPSLRAQNSGTYAMVSGNYTAPAIADGETINLSFDFRVTNVQNGTLRFALGSSTENIAFNIGTGTSLSGNLVRYPADYVSGATSTDHTLTGTPFAINDSAAHSLSLSLTRSGSTLLIAGDVDASHLVTGSRANVTNFTFNRIRFGQGNTTMYYNIDNVIVGIPEPATVTLLCLPAAGLIMRRRRQ